MGVVGGRRRVGGGHHISSGMFQHLRKDGIS